MNPSILGLKIKDFRAIKEANIGLDGITVVAGENSSGKSTLSRLLYYSHRISDGYEDFVKRDLSSALEPLFWVIRNFSNRFSESYFKIMKNPLDKKNTLMELEKIKEDFLKRNNEKDSFIFRAQKLLQENFSDILTEKFEIKKELSIDELFDLIKNIFVKKHEAAERNIKIRDKKLFFKALEPLYKNDLENFSVLEYGDAILCKEKENLGEFKAITKAIYMDSPLSVDMPEEILDGVWDSGNYFEHWNYLDDTSFLGVSYFGHWNYLDNHLKNKNQKVLSDIVNKPEYKEILELFRNKKALDGEVIVSDTPKELVYHRQDGKYFRMEECATGIKSLSALQTLYKNGWLTNKTLLILDEPEAHLHPQWVVEYARLIVLLHKKVGVTFFISSHHPDMISAIQDICDKEGQNDTLRFYLAKKQKDYRYTFEDQGTSIGKIFDSFNIAISRINEYAGDE